MHATFAPAAKLIVTPIAALFAFIPVSTKAGTRTTNMHDWFDILPLSQVNHRLFVGGRASCAELAKSNPHKITAVLNVDQQADVQINPEIIYMHVPFDDGEAIPKRQFSRCLGWLGFMFEAGHTILIHCAAGISRSVTIMASFMHYVHVMDFDLALHQIKMTRPVANPAPAVVISAKKMLGVWPYDGSMQGQQPEHEKAIEDAFIWMDAHRLAQIHPSDGCPMRAFLLANNLEDNRPRHEIPCTCETLNQPGL